MENAERRTQNAESIMIQKALDISFDHGVGTQHLEELNAALAEGWKVVDHEVSGGGNILVILEKDDGAAA
jgi:hypothetical protein